MRFFYSPAASTPHSRSKRSPDALFRHRDAEYPGVVIKVSYSQKREALHCLAYDYLIKSNGSTQVMVGFDIRYSGSRKASLSVWRHNYVEDRDYLALALLRDKNEEVSVNL